MTKRPAFQASGRSSGMLSQKYSRATKLAPVAQKNLLPAEWRMPKQRKAKRWLEAPPVGLGPRVELRGNRGGKPERRACFIEEQAAFRVMPENRHKLAAIFITETSSI